MTPKRGVVSLTLLIFVCATADLETFLLATRRAAINNARTTDFADRINGAWGHTR